jgi:hypothetical protein
MNELTIYWVYATYTTTDGKKRTGPVTTRTTLYEAIEALAGARATYTIAQEYGEVKYFTLHLEEQHLEPSKEA